MRGNWRKRPTYDPDDNLDEVIRKHLVRLHEKYDGVTTFIQEASGLSRRSVWRYRSRWPELKEF